MQIDIEILENRLIEIKSAAYYATIEECQDEFGPSIYYVNAHIRGTGEHITRTQHSAVAALQYLINLNATLDSGRRTLESVFND